MHALCRAGIRSDTIFSFDWIRRLRQFADRQRKEEARKNPAVNFLEVADRKYADGSANDKIQGKVIFDTEQAQRLDRTFHNLARDTGDLVSEGHINRIVEEW